MGHGTWVAKDDPFPSLGEAVSPPTKPVDFKVHTPAVGVPATIFLLGSARGLVGLNLFILSVTCHNRDDVNIRSIFAFTPLL